MYPSVVFIHYVYIIIDSMITVKAANKLYSGEEKFRFCSLEHRIRSARIAALHGALRTRVEEVTRPTFTASGHRMHRSIIIGRMVNCPSSYTSLSESSTHLLGSIYGKIGKTRTSFHSPLFRLLCQANNFFRKRFDAHRGW